MYLFYITGVVQGVGFRPFVYQECKKKNITGYVKNIATGVLADVSDKEAFLEILKSPPSLARIDAVDITENDEVYVDFKILKSTGSGHSEIPADLFMCGKCELELKNEKNRRYNHFFITCTNCGPRFSVTQKNPYDRINTTMSEFAMCADCKIEYTNPDDRRYHAQTIACNNCGPELFFNDKKNNISVKGQSSIKLAVDKILEGEVVSIKGIGGFHLACLTKDDAVAKLRKITNRPNKPYAILCKDIAMAKKVCQIDEVESKLLLSKERPIVVLKSKFDLSGVSELDSIGVMLPYTALHFLLFDFINEPIVMTSSNYPDQPITIIEDEQIPEYILTHNRRIENAVDDSVIKVILKNPVFLRRSRGFVPTSIDLLQLKNLVSFSDIKILALGAEMNNSFCIYENSKATLSQYLGTTSNLSTFENYKKMLDKFLEYNNIKPDLIVCDLHPSYNTSVYAQELADKFGVKLLRVQHHKAHSYSIAVEHDLTDFTVIICDGLGYGEDGTIWGGEVFSSDKRVGHLEEQILPGGDSATIFPEKMLFGILRKFMSIDQIKELNLNLTDNEIETLDKMILQNYNCPKTTSTGRILDAASALLGFCLERTYDGRPAMLLEANSTESYELKPLIIDDVLMTTYLFEFLIKNINLDKKRLAATVQQYLAEGLLEIAKKFSKENGNNKILFGGGCAYNRIMTSHMLKNGVLINEKTPPGDGGIALGQVYFALLYGE